VELSDQAEDQKQELKMLRAMVENERDHVKGTDTNFEKLHREYSKLVIENEALQSKHNDIKQSNDRLVELRGELER
jgi:archaellum component FlaC